LACSVTVYTQAYNTGKYIEQCIKSVLKQNFKDFEYIIVDNGSTDKTKEIISAYSNVDDRIKVLRLEKNQRGFWFDLIKSKAKGKYFTTLDSDDYWEENFLDELYYLAEKKDLDIAIGGSKFYYMGTDNIGYRRISEELIIEGSELANQFIKLYQFIRPVWGKLFKVSLLNSIDYTDTKKLFYGGDTSFCIESLKYVNKVGVSQKILHNYRVHMNSLSFNYNVNRFNSDVFLFHQAKNFLESFSKISDENYIFIYCVYINSIIDTINVALECNFCITDKLSEIQKIISNELTQEMFNVLHNMDQLKIFKRNMLEIFLQYGIQNINNQDIMDLIYYNIGLLNEDIPIFILRKDLSQHIKNNDFILSIINLDIKKILKKSLSSLDTAVLMRIEWEILKDCFEDNILLNWIDNKNFVLQYSDVISDIYINNFHHALKKMIKILSNIDDKPFQEEIVFTCLNVSAILENAEIFIYAKKIQTQLFIKNRKKEDALMALNDLLEMSPNDKEIIKLKEYMEENNV
jgi:glycosyltransferase involved in cell wall biosynthesis